MFDERNASKPAYVPSVVSVSSTPDIGIFRGGKLRSMYLPADA
jgi:hypothetical protein